jgi:NAD(P)-dependent dehydrogenase (short-subunit alcohol dehydrogenase family)
MKSVLVIGATGDVGQGVCGELLHAGWRVIAAGRTAAKLEALKQRIAAKGKLEYVTGDVSTESGAAALRDAALKLAGTLDAVVTTVNPDKTAPVPILERSADELTELLRGNIVAHFIAAKTFIPVIAKGGMYLSIGGGMADFIVPGMGVTNICQAGQRNLFRIIAREARGGPVQIRELLLVSMIAGESNRANAEPSWLTDEDCGRHVAAVLAQPDVFAGPILAVRSREQVGKPEPQPAR